VQCGDTIQRRNLSLPAPPALGGYGTKAAKGGDSIFFYGFPNQAILNAFYYTDLGWWMQIKCCYFDMNGWIFPLPVGSCKIRILISLLICLDKITIKKLCSNFYIQDI